MLGRRIAPRKSARWAIYFLAALALDFRKRLRETIEILILQVYRHFISGGAQGMDIMAAETVLDLQKQYSDVTLEMAIPFEGQADR